MNYIEKVEELSMPVIALRGLVIFPGFPTSIEIGRNASVVALQAATAAGGTVFLTAQKDMKAANPSLANCEETGCVARIVQATKLGGGKFRVIVEGKCRGKISVPIGDTPYMRAKILATDIVLRDKGGVKGEALILEARARFEEFLQLIPKPSSELVTMTQVIDEPGALADHLALNILHRIENKQSILETYDPIKRLEKLLIFLENETEVLKTQMEIHAKVKAGIERNQSEYYLREELKVIQEQLGMSDDEFVDEEGEPVEEDDDIAAYLTRIRESGCPKDVKKALMKETAKLRRMPLISSESSVLREYLDTVLALPWGVKTKDVCDVEKASKVLEKEHDGLREVKDRILEYIAVKQLSPNLCGQILCLVGPPGVGKTSVAMSVAHAMKRKFVRVSLGGIRDEADIRGHRKTYVAAMPGRIMTAIKNCGSQNPVVLLDELDKMSKDMHGDPGAALLEVLDIDQNKTFRDHYVEFPFDISDCVFIATANTLETVPRPLLDRMEIIELKAYTPSEKKAIFKNHLLPKELARHGLTKSKLRISDDALDEIIEYYTREAGVRNLERETAALCRKAARKLVEDPERKTVTVKAQDVKEFLGKRKFDEPQEELIPKVGVVNGLAWTQVGGELLQVEVLSMPGKGVLETTGSLGDVMKESVKAAVSYIRKNAGSLGIDPEFHNKLDIHVHFPEGATPKDGPSAGITTTTAIVSELSGKKVRGDIAMTGEVTLTGRVLPIGGLREKTMAAYTHGIRTVIIPKANEKDIEDCDALVRENVHFIPVTEVSEVLAAALVNN